MTSDYLDNSGDSVNQNKSIDQSIFKSYDIRGIYPTQLSERSIVPIIKAIYTFFQHSLGKNSSLTLVLGYDMRLSSPSLYEVSKKALIERGANIIDIGLVSTPTFYFAVNHYHYECGIQITASHNPKDYNGLKFVLNSPNGLIKIGKSTGMDKVKDLALAGEFITTQLPGGVSSKADVVDDEVTFAISQLHHPHLKKCTVVADPANAMGATYLEAIAKRVPMNLIRMNFELDGSFPSHQPDPLDYNNLKDLQARVLQEKADFGLAPDGDGDRLFFIDEKGQVVPASIVTALLARELLKDHAGDLILFDIRYILTPKTVIEEAGGRTQISKVGHAFITEQMGNTGALFAGESSAHYFYKVTGNAESQVMTIIAMLKILSEANKPLSALVEEVRRSFESGEINFRVSNALEIMDVLTLQYQDGQHDLLDGIAITYPTWRFSVRTSNTEPLLRLNVEARTEEVLNEKRDELVKAITKNAKQ